MGNSEKQSPEISSEINDPDKKLSLELSSLRDEIRKSEEARLDFLKYKLIAVATLTAVAFGLGSWGSDNPDLEPRYILIVIPFVCVYVDALCYHNNLRIFVIAKYLRCHRDSYEQFLDQWNQILEITPRKRVDNHDAHFLDNCYQTLVDMGYKMLGKEPTKSIGYFFEMEDWVLNISTKALAAFVAIAGLFSCSPLQQLTIFSSGVMGIILSWFMKRQYDARFDRTTKNSCDQIAEKPPSGI